MLRPVTQADRPALLDIERQSTPGLQYLNAVYELFLADAPHGEFMLIEEGGVPLGCAKYTLLPDHSAWLETLRVPPAAQGRGLGKKMYTRFFELAQAQGVHTMRMYTGLTNVVSKGLAERFGFTLEETFFGYTQAVSSQAVQDADTSPHPTPAFRAVTDPDEATALLLPLRPAWGHFLVMNRTFYPFVPKVCADLARRGMVYASSQQDVLVAGARFSPEQALHLALFSGNVTHILDFARHLARSRAAQQLVCLYPIAQQATTTALQHAKFTPDPGEYIVMKVELQPGR